MVNTRAQLKKTLKRSGALIGSSDDLITEILLRLPVTSVLRFKSVSKHWRSLLSHPPFTLLYGSISPGLFLHDLYIPFDDEDQSPPPFRNLDFYPDRRGIRIIQSCNGLLFCCSKEGIQRDLKYYVFNPTTRQFALVPSVPGGGEVRRTIRYMGLAFHQTDCVHYKVVCIRYVKRDEDLFQIQIYLSETGKWKILDESIYAPYYIDFYGGVYWHQAIHWFCKSGYQCLKLDREEIKPLPLPAAFASSIRYTPLYFGESRGHLHMVDFVDSHVSSLNSFLHLNVYEMLDDHSGWFVKYRVDLERVYVVYRRMISRLVGGPQIEFINSYQVLDIVRGEEENETFMVIRIEWKIIRYNVLKKTFKLISDLKNRIHGPNLHWEACRYIKTIVSF